MLVSSVSGVCVEGSVGGVIGEVVVVLCGFGVFCGLEFGWDVESVVIFAFCVVGEVGVSEDQLCDFLLLSKFGIL